MIQGISSKEFDALTRLWFYVFVQRVFAELNPGRQFHASGHVEVICAEMEALFRGDNRRLIVNVPPRNLKSMIISVAFTAWVLGRDPTKRFLIVSYGQDLAQNFARDILRVMRSSWYRRLFPGARIDPAQGRFDDFRTTRNGGVKVESIQGGVTGFGADFITIDDPMRPLDVIFEHTRQKINETVLNSVMSRQDGVGAARVTLVMQRLHEDDTTGFLMQRQADKWPRLRLPAIAEEDERIEYATPFGAALFERKAGDALNPAYEPLDRLRDQEELEGPYYWSGHYQQNPMPMGGGIIKPEWFQQVPRSEFPQKFDMVVQSWDTAVKTADSNDYSVCTTWGIAGTQKYLLDVRREKMEFTALKHAVLAMRSQYNPSFVLIEDRASGQQLIQVLREERISGIEPVTPTLNKEVRAMGQTPAMRNVVLEKGAPWVDAFLLEAAHFPKGRYDDQVDSMTQALEWMRDRQIPSSNFFLYIEQETLRAAQKPGRSGGEAVRMQGPPGITLQFSGRPSQTSNDGIYHVPKEAVGALIGRGFRVID